MKSKKSFGKAAITKICSFIVLVLFLSNCSHTSDPLKVSPLSPDENPASSLEKTVIITETVQLEGISVFPVYIVKEHRILNPPEEMFATCTAKLSHINGLDYKLETIESVGTMVYREVSFLGKMTHGGFVEFPWPEKWIELGAEATDVVGQIFNHTGIVLHGPGINKGTIIYSGRFDGQNFKISTHLLGKQVQPGSMPQYIDPLEGPLLVRFAFDLHVVK